MKEVRMIPYITEEDLDVINIALASGADVMIKTTQHGVKILRETVNVLKKKDKDGKEIPK